MVNIPGGIVRPSPYPVPETIDRVQALLRTRGSFIYARIDQQAELRTVGHTIQPLQFLLFGNPQAGGPLLVTNPAAALDLPLKIIAWEDDRHQTWVAHNAAAYIEQRYTLPAIPNSPLDLSPLLAQVLG
jgi:uncharacterized protein (DUF302 family)